MFAEKTINFKNEINELFKNTMGLRIMITDGDKGKIRITTYQDNAEELKKQLKEHFKDKIQINDTRQYIVYRCTRIYVQLIEEKEGIDKEIEELENKLQELKEKRRIEKQKIKNAEKIKQLKKQIEELSNK